MAQLNRLTARQIDAFREDGIYADGGGLYLRVRGNAKHFLFIFTLDGRRREMGLGAPPGVTLKSARERAQAARELAAEGKNPIDERNALRRRPTFGVLADEWIASRKSAVRNTKSVDRWERAIGSGGYAESLRALRVDRVTTTDVLDVLKPIWSKGPTATLARGYIEAVLDAAKVRGFRAGENPARWKGHLDHLLAPPPKLQRGHHAALPYAKVPEFMSQLRQNSSVVARLIEFIVLTAARVGEALNATWSEVDLEARNWTIPANRMKAGRAHTVPLSPRSVELLQGLLRDGVEGSDAIFLDRGRVPSNMAGSMMLRRMGVSATLHGFRSSFRDWAGDMTDFPREIAEAALAHSVGGVEAAYRRGHALTKRRQLMEAWDNFCATS